MLEQGHNYLDGPIHSMREIFETRSKNVEKSIPSSIPSRNKMKPNKVSKKRKAVTFGVSEDEDLEDEYKVKKFCRYHGMCGHTTDECTTLKTLVKQAKQKKGKHFEKKKRFIKHEVNIIVQKQAKNALKQKKKKHSEELRAF